MDAKLLNKYIAGDALPEEKKGSDTLDEGERRKSGTVDAVAPCFTMPLYGMETYRQKKQRTRNL